MDLAGSERAKKSGTSGLRLREASNINRSLSTLGDVINALIAAAPKGKGSASKGGAGKGASARGGRAGTASKHIPYRNSNLTWLLRDSIGGNARGLMIGTISAAEEYYDESLSTLRFVDRAKRIKVDAVVNVKQDASQAVIEDLRRQVTELRKRLAKAEAIAKAADIGGAGPAGGRTSGSSLDGSSSASSASCDATTALDIIRVTLSERENLMTVVEGHQLFGGQQTPGTTNRGTCLAGEDTQLHGSRDRSALSGPSPLPSSVPRAAAGGGGGGGGSGDAVGGAPGGATSVKEKDTSQQGNSESALSSGTTSRRRQHGVAGDGSSAVSVAGEQAQAAGARGGGAPAGSSSTKKAGRKPRQASPARLAPPLEAEFFYVDPSRKRHGPFTAEQMRLWHESSYLRDDLPICKRFADCTPLQDDDFVQLGSLLSTHGIERVWASGEDLPRCSSTGLRGIACCRGHVVLAATTLQAFSRGCTRRSWWSSVGLPQALVDRGKQRASRMIQASWRAQRDRRRLAAAAMSGAASSARNLSIDLHRFRGCHVDSFQNLLMSFRARRCLFKSTRRK